MLKRIAAITLVFVCTSFAWIFLGATVAVRTRSQDASLKNEVGQLWGVPQRQRAPSAYYLPPPPTPAKRGASPSAEGSAAPTVVGVVPTVATAPQQSPVPGGSTAVPLESSDVDVTLDLEHRSKGLLWYSTYRVRFDGAYVVTNASEEPHDYCVVFSLPTKGAIYDNFRLAVGEREVSDLAVSDGRISAKVALAPGQSETIRLGYGTQGLDEWWYEFGDSVSQMRNFSLTMRTNFDEVDFPQNSISPTQKTKVDGGWELEWSYSNLLSGVQIGMAMPQKLNPGPWVSEITFFAPVSLFFFFFLLFIFSTIRGVRIHPMNYFFAGTGFFAFHLLLTYLVDHISIHAAFAIASAVSLFLVTSYMRLVVGARFAIFHVGVAQLVYLVLFSYTFFFERYTGLAVTILSIVTLFIVMQITGRIDWEQLTRETEKTEPPPNTRVTPA
jgi:hypothetical protein